MLRIVAVGCVQPERVLTDEALADLGIVPSHDQHRLEWGVRHRYTVCPKGSGKLYPAKSSLTSEEMKIRYEFTVKPLVDMAVKATKIAISKAGINHDDIGIILGDTATPIQTIPAFGALVACELGLKVPAYDVIGGSASLLLQLETLLSWRDSAIPRYSMLVSSNVFTPYLTFSKDDECSWVLSDSAGVLIVEKVDQAKGLMIERSRYCRSGAGVDAVQEIYAMVSGKAEPSGASLDQIQEISDEFDLSDVSTWVVGTPTLRSGHVVAELLGGNGDSMCWCGDEGFSLGSTIYLGFDRLINDSNFLDTALICVAGPEGNVGVAKVVRY